MWNYIDRVVIIKIINRNIKGKKALSYTLKSHKHVEISFVLVFHYSKEVVSKENKYFRCRVKVKLFLNKIWFLHKKTKQNIGYKKTCHIC